MPKTRRPKSLLTKPVSSAPSSLALSTNNTASRDDGSSARTVNELLQDSRRAQNQIPSAQTIRASSSIHPTLRAVLNIPAPTAPAPPHDVRGSTRLRRIPGPPPPRSWLSGAGHSSTATVTNISSVGQMMVANHTSMLPNAGFPPEVSLQHLTLKSMATNWKWHARYDHEYLSDLPTLMKEMLLTYISIYNDETSINPLRVFFPETSSTNDNSEITRMDLGNAIGRWTTPRQIQKDLTSREKQSPGSQTKSMPDANTHVVPENWEEDEGLPSTELKMASSLAIKVRFKNLKHISLAVTPSISGTMALWQDLLSLASKLPTIVSLSLAYWPQPTFTPNASLGRHKVHRPGGSSPSIIYGGSDFYTEFDGNWREAAGILRTLSRSFYCLEWLDLTGCGNWLPALTWQAEGEDDPNTGPDWNGSWRRINHLTLGVGWKPAPLAHKAKMSSLDPLKGRPQEIDVGPLSNLTISHPGGHANSEQTGIESWDVDEERDIYRHRKQVERCMELMNCSKKVVQDLRVIRKAAGGRWIDADFGKSEFW